MGSQTELEKLITQYSLDTENPEHNFSLGIWYDSHGHTAPALSYFLRCAERADDDDLAYEALIKASYCYQKQGTRDGSAKSLLEQALVLLPKRPEAYFLLSRFAEKREFWQDCYIHANNALNWCDFDHSPLRTDVEYPGKYGLLFEKALSAWWWGKTEESRNLLIDIKKNYKLSPEYLKAVNDNLVKVGVPVEDDEEEFRFTSDFDWGDLTYEDKITIEREIEYERVYDFWRKVEPDDVVMDIGASVGPFTCSALINKAKKVYCVEPSKTLLSSLAKNTTPHVLNYDENPIQYINYAIVEDPSQKVNIFGTNTQFKTTTFKNIITKNSIEKINFLKIDCEGGEYAVFLEENMDFLLNKVEFIAMEVHLNYDGCREKFKNFRNNFLVRFPEYKVMSCTRQNIFWGYSVDIKDRIFDDSFVDEYTCEFMIYIWNKKKVQQFDWGELDSWYADLYAEENFVDKTYQKHYSVKENDLVVDIGANCGSFTYSILPNNPKHVYCIEPDDRWVKCLRKNVKNGPVSVTHKFISDVNDDKSITFKKFIRDNNIDSIDFLKFDCEGGEYSIFTKENYDFISKKVKNAAGEWHFAPIQEAGFKFIQFRDMYLKPGKFKVYDRSFTDYTERVFDNQFIINFENYSWGLHNSEAYTGQFLLYMWN